MSSFLFREDWDPVYFESSIEFKLFVLHKILDKLHKIQRVEIYDDRHFDLFEAKLKGYTHSNRIETFKVHTVFHQDLLFLPPEVERILAEKIINDHNKKMKEGSLLTDKLLNLKPTVELFESIGYSGVFLTKESRELIIKTFDLPPRYLRVAHHVTICLGPLSRYKWDNQHENVDNGNVKIISSNNLN